MDNIWHPPAPMDNSTDFTVISSDGKHFYVHKELLEAASPNFFQLNPEHIGDLTDFCMASEPAAVLKVLIDHIYPSQTPYAQPSLDLLAAVLQAADKYRMEAIMSILACYLDAHMHKSPLAVYAIATLVKLKKRAGYAWKLLFSMPQSELLGSKKGLITVTQFADILEARYRRASEISSRLNDYVHKPPHNGRRFKCGSCGAVPAWIHWWLRAVEAELRDAPVTKNIFNVTFIEESKESFYTLCKCKLKFKPYNGALDYLKHSIDAEFPLPELIWLD